jgi:hypothetical protein
MTVFILLDPNSGICLDGPCKLFYTFFKNPGQCFAHFLKHENFRYDKWQWSSVNQSSGVSDVEGKRIVIASTEWPKNHRTSAYRTTPCVLVHCAGNKVYVSWVGGGGNKIPTKIYKNKFHATDAKILKKNFGAILKM